jgi:hypothetical protein
VEARITRSARRHSVSAGRIREALSGARLVRVEGDAALYVGTDARGLELEMVLVPDARRPGAFAVIHAMPTAWREQQ